MQKSEDKLHDNTRSVSQQVIAAQWLKIERLWVQFSLSLEEIHYGLFFFLMGSNNYLPSSIEIWSHFLAFCQSAKIKAKQSGKA